MRVSERQLQTIPSNEFSGRTKESAFKSHGDFYLHSTTVYILHPPRSYSSSPSATTSPWIVAAINGSLKLQLRHPLTLKHQLWNLPQNFDLSKLHPTALAVSHHVSSSFDKLLVVPKSTAIFSDINYNNNDNLHECTLLALYDGGQLRGYPPYANGKEKSGSSTWIEISRGSCIDLFDDITIYQGKIYALDRQGKLCVINNYIASRELICETLINHPMTPGSGRFGWRKRLVVDGKRLYLVVRATEKLLHVYLLIKQGNAFNWSLVEGFFHTQVLFMARDYYFFWWAGALSEFPGRQFSNCIVFLEGAFPWYGKDCWDFTQKLGVVRKSEEDIAIFRLADGAFAREGENGEFPKLNWSPPPWVFHAWSGPAAESSSPSLSDSYSQSEREPDEDESLNSNCRYEKDEEVQF